jgi:hypothetical protein
MYEPTTGRFNRLDDYAGNAFDPQSFHKYAYVHGDPVNATDPTGKFISLAIGFAFRSSLQSSRLVQGAVALGLAADLGLIANFTFLRNFSNVFYDKGTFIPVDKGRLESHYHSVRIRNSQKTADELFSQMSRFSELNTYPVRAYQNASQVGDVVTWDMIPLLPNEFGQGDFDVKVTKLDAVNRSFTVRTLAGHPLAGWRLWRARSIGSDILLETFSVEHAATAWDTVKLSMGGLEGMYSTWTNMLNDLATFSKGEIVFGPETVLHGEDRSHLVQQYLPLVE